MAANGQPLLMRSELTGTVYVVTSYKDLGEGRIEALKKYDVTDQFNALVAVLPLNPKREDATNEHG
jgi:hypothetical protein